MEDVEMTYIMKELESEWVRDETVVEGKSIYFFKANEHRKFDFPETFPELNITQLEIEKETIEIESNEEIKIRNKAFLDKWKIFEENINVLLDQGLEIQLNDISTFLINGNLYK